MSVASEGGSFWAKGSYGAIEAVRNTQAFEATKVSGDIGALRVVGAVWARREVRAIVIVP